MNYTTRQINRFYNARKRFYQAKHPTGNLFMKIADLAKPGDIGVTAYKVVYQFVGNNHMLRTNNLVFFCKTPDEARTMGTKFLNENNLPWYKILSVQAA